MFSFESLGEKKVHLLMFSVFFSFFLSFPLSPPATCFLLLLLLNLTLQSLCSWPDAGRTITQKKKRKKRKKKKEHTNRIRKEECGLKRTGIERGAERAHSLLLLLLHLLFMSSLHHLSFLPSNLSPLSPRRGACFWGFVMHPAFDSAGRFSFFFLSLSTHLKGV